MTNKSEADSNSLCQRVRENVRWIDVEDPRIVCKEAIAQLEFDGTKDSFEIALGNLTGCRKLREYGLINKMPILLKSICCLYHEIRVASVSGLVVAHDNNLLIKVTNTKSLQSAQVLFLDIDFLFRHEKDSIEQSESEHDFREAQPRYGSFALQNEFMDVVRPIPKPNLERYKHGFVLLVAGVTFMVIAMLNSWTSGNDEATA